MSCCFAPWWRVLSSNALFDHAQMAPRLLLSLYQYMQARALHEKCAAEGFAVIYKSRGAAKQEQKVARSAAGLPLRRVSKVGTAVSAVNAQASVSIDAMVSSFLASSCPCLVDTTCSVPPASPLRKPCKPFFVPPRKASWALREFCLHM